MPRPHGRWDILEKNHDLRRARASSSFLAERLLGSRQQKMVARRKSVHFTTENFNMEVLSELIKSCNQFCIFSATGKVLLDYDSARSDLKAEGDLAVTQNLYFATFATRHHDPWPKSCDVQQPRNSPEAELIEGLKANAFFGPVKAISISQIPSEYGIDVYVPNSATDGSHKHGMAWITVCRGITHMARQSIQVHRQHEIPDDREVPHCPLREPRHDG